MWYKDLDRSLFRFVRDHACDRQTDRRTDRQTDRILLAIPCLHYMQRGKNVPIAKALQLEAARRHASRSALFLAKCVLHVRTNCYFPASVDSDIAIKFSDPDFPKDSNTVAIKRRRKRAIANDCLTLNVCHVIKLCTKLERNRTTEQSTGGLSDL